MSVGKQHQRRWKSCKSQISQVKGQVSWVELFEIATRSWRYVSPKANYKVRPIVNKYREGKLKSTLKREWKVRETVEGELDWMLSCPMPWFNSRPKGCDVVVFWHQLQKQAIVNFGFQFVVLNKMRYIYLFFACLTSTSHSTFFAARLETRTKECVLLASVGANWKRTRVMKVNDVTFLRCISFSGDSINAMSCNHGRFCC